MLEYLKGTKEELPDILDFANYVFSHNHSPADFGILQPMIYKPKYNGAVNHFTAHEDGRIKGLLCSIPAVMEIIGKQLSLFRVGTVCVHPYSRGCGYMSRLFEYALSEMKDNAADFAILGGQRQRYGYFGYELCGQDIHIRINAANLRHTYAGEPNGTFKIVPVDDDSMYSCKIAELYNRRPVRILRETGYLPDIMRTWGGQGYILLSQGEFTGYFSASQGGGRIFEFELTDNCLYEDFLQAYAAYFSVNEFSVYIESFSPQKLKSLSHIYETLVMEKLCNMRIFNYENFLDAFLRLKSAIYPIISGSLRVEIENAGTFELTVDGSDAMARYTALHSDISLSEADAVRLFTTPEAFCFKPPCSPEKASLFYSWFPLPFSVSYLDRI